MRICNKHGDDALSHTGPSCPACKDIRQLLDMVTDLRIRERDHSKRIQEMRDENKCLANRRPTQTVYRETAATQEKLRLSAEMIRHLKSELRKSREDYERYGTRIYLLDGDVANLKDWLAEAEKERDQLQTRLDDLEDRPIKEPQRSGDTGAGNGPDVFPRTWR